MSDSKIRVGMTSFHCCIRKIKLAYTLKQLGHEVHLVLAQIPGHVSLHFADSVTIYFPNNANLVDKSSFRNAIKTLDDKVDLWVHHNEPDWQVKQIKEVSKKPVIFDLHDLASDRDLVITQDEVEAISLADGILCQESRYVEMMAARRPDLAEKGLIDYYLNCLPRDWVPRLPAILNGSHGHNIGSVVYEGGLSEQPGGQEFAYRYWLPFMAEVVKNFVRVDVYPGDGARPFEAYQKAGIARRPTLQYLPLIAHLSGYHWGLAGCAFPHPAFSAAMPNKTFEYMAAGIPQFVINAPLIEKFVTDNKIGLVVTSPMDVVKAAGCSGDFVPNVLKAREQFVMENEVPKILKLYEKVIG